jgi:hypothetical protein
MKPRGFCAMFVLALIVAPRAALAMPWPIGVRVVDAAGRGVANVKVAACEVTPGSITCGKALARATSGSDGAAAIYLPSGHYRGGLMYVEVIDRKYDGKLFLRRYFGNGTEGPFAPFSIDNWPAEIRAPVCGALQPLQTNNSITIIPDRCGSAGRL